MKKWIIIILMSLVTTQIVIAMEDCKGIMNPSDIPCSVTSSWQFPNNCTTYNINIYNETPSLLDTRTMDAYGVSGRCNITFNYTKRGSYLLNWSSGDSSKINVEADEMNYITIGIMLAVITFVFAYLATQVKHWLLQIGLSLFTFVMVMFDFFIAARIIEVVDSAQTGMVHYLDTFFFIAVTLFRFVLAATVIFLIYYMYRIVLTNPLRKRKVREEESLYE